MKSLQMNVRVFVEYDPSYARPGPEFKCFVCGKWFKELLYWIDKNFYPMQKYKLTFLCSAECSLKGVKHERKNIS